MTDRSTSQWYQNATDAERAEVDAIDREHAEVAARRRAIVERVKSTALSRRRRSAQSDSSTDQ